MDDMAVLDGGLRKDLGCVFHRGVDSPKPEAHEIKKYIRVETKTYKISDCRSQILCHDRGSLNGSATAFRGAIWKIGYPESKEQETETSSS
jgi:hypothetical protein